MKALYFLIGSWVISWCIVFSIVGAVYLKAKLYR